MTKIAGVTQSREHAKAARTLSDARASLLMWQRYLERGSDVAEDVENAEIAVEAAQSALRKAFLKYTNPFGIRKTV